MRENRREDKLKRRTPREKRMSSCEGDAKENSRICSPTSRLHCKHSAAKASRDLHIVVTT